MPVGPVNCVDVACIQAGKTATFYGHTASGALYRARATDLAEPGAGTDTFDFVTSDGYSAGGILSAGDIEVH